MKRLLLTTIAAGCSLAAFGQGEVVFENYNLSSIQAVYLIPGNTLAPVGNPGFTVTLLWFNGASFQTIDTYQTTGSPNVPGYFNAGTVTVPTFAPTGTFEIEGWYNTSGNYPTLAAVVNATTGTTYVGGTASFTATEVQNPTLPIPIDVGTGSWNGNLALISFPEPSTIAIGSLGAAVLLLLRRRK